MSTSRWKQVPCGPLSRTTSTRGRTCSQLQARPRPCQQGSPWPCGHLTTFSPYGDQQLGCAPHSAHAAAQHDWQCLLHPLHARKICKVERGGAQRWRALPAAAAAAAGAAAGVHNTQLQVLALKGPWAPAAALPCGRVLRKEQRPALGARPRAGGPCTCAP
jgi:hypothetical protein